MDMIKVCNLNKSYRIGKNKISVLENVSFSIKRGEFVIISGKSGCGKSTLLHLLGGLDVPDSGDIYINNTNIVKLSCDDMTVFRRKNIGFVFQSFNLFSNLSVKENILLPSKIDKRVIGSNELYKLIKDLGLKDKINFMPFELSGGQVQRVAIGRALINNPCVLFLDEPTGNLDSCTKKQIMKLFKYFNKVYKQTIVMVTHDENIVSLASRIIRIENGVIYDSKQ